MKGKKLVLQFSAVALGALTQSMVMAAAVDYKESDAAKQKTQTQKAAQKVDKQAPAARTAVKGDVGDNAVKMGDGSVKK